MKNSNALTRQEENANRDGARCNDNTNTRDKAFKTKIKFYADLLHLKAQLVLKCHKCQAGMSAPNFWMQKEIKYLVM